jgi:hypothetical protein
MSRKKALDPTLLALAKQVATGDESARWRGRVRPRERQGAKQVATGDESARVP